MNCPVCNSTVLYAGLNSLECAGRGCQNYKGPVGVTYGPEPVDFYWACAWATQVARGLGCLDKLRVEEHSSAVYSCLVHGLPLSPISMPRYTTRDELKGFFLTDPQVAPYL